MGQKMPLIPISFTDVSEHACWYTVVTKFNYEQKFAKDLMAGLHNIGLQDKILEVLIPNKETVIKYTDKKGKEKEKVKVEKIMPLYVFVKAVMDDKVFTYLRNTAGCANIMACGGSLLVMEEADIIKIKKQCGIYEKELELQKKKKMQELENAKSGLIDKIGDKIKIASGMFANYEAILHKLNFNTGKASVILENGMPIEVEIMDLALV